VKRREEMRRGEERKEGKGILPLILRSTAGK
jgi:hypothetical protein